MRILILLNPRSGTNRGASAAEQEAHLKTGFAALGVEAEVMLCHGPAAALCAERGLAGLDAVVAAGGDGTVSGVAAALAGTPVPMGVLPLGTLNHFARDLGLPSDLDAAMRIVAAGATRRVDVAEVNGRIFVNNASLGFYPQLVVERDEQQRRLGAGKWLAMTLAALRVLRRLPLPRLRLLGDGVAVARRTPLLFVGNNLYVTDLFALGRRAALDAGELSVYLVAPQSRLGLVSLALRALVGRLDRGRDFVLYRLRELRVETRRHRVHVALDGEPGRLAPPLLFKIRPGALQVLAPKPEDQP